jgi:ubiquinone/menaquinone biosynthesis C-methylase UbiE
MKPKSKNKKPWYSEEYGFFGEHYMKEYSHELPSERTKLETDFIEKVLKLRKGAKILDLGCGHGRHSVELAKRGFKVTGQDLNSYFLKLAEESSKNLKVNVRWIKSDMRKIPFTNEFNTVLNLFTAFGYLETDEEDEKVMKQISNALKPRGKFLMDVSNRDRIIRNYIEKDWTVLPDSTIELTEKKYDPVRGGHEDIRTYLYPDGTKKKFVLWVRMYTITEITAMMKRAGLVFKEAYGDYNFTPYNSRSRRCIILAQK